MKSGDWKWLNDHDALSLMIWRLEGQKNVNLSPTVSLRSSPSKYALIVAEIC